MADVSGKNDDKRFQVITSALDDCRRLIAAGKVQRWDVVKWGVAVNTGVASASVALGYNIPLLVLAVAVAIASWLLVRHYNRRMTGARETATTLTKRLKSSYKIDYDDIVKINVTRAYSAGEDYDWQELTLFAIILGAGPLLALVGAVWSAFAH